jgi:hypothetical protein
MLVEGVDYLPVENGKSFYDVLVVIDWNFTAVGITKSNIGKNTSQSAKSLGLYNRRQGEKIGCTSRSLKDVCSIIKMIHVYTFL